VKVEGNNNETQKEKLSNQIFKMKLKGKENEQA